MAYGRSVRRACSCVSFYRCYPTLATRLPQPSRLPPCQPLRRVGVMVCWGDEGRRTKDEGLFTMSFVLPLHHHPILHRPAHACYQFAERSRTYQPTRMGTTLSPP